MIELFTLTLIALAPCSAAPTQNCESAVLVFTEIAGLESCIIEGENLQAAINPFKGQAVTFSAVCEFAGFQAVAK